MLTVIQDGHTNRHGRSNYENYDSDVQDTVADHHMTATYKLNVGLSSKLMVLSTSFSIPVYKHSYR